MNKLDLCPLQESYSVKYGTSVERIAFRGGFGRYIQTKNAKKHLVDVSFTLREDDFIYFRAFYLNWQLNPLPFLMSLIIEDSEFREYIAQFVPESFAFNELKGNIFKVSAQVVVVTTEVQILTSKPYPLECDESISSRVSIGEGRVKVAAVENNAEYEVTTSSVLIQNAVVRDLSTRMDFSDSTSSTVMIHDSILKSVLVAMNPAPESTLSYVIVQDGKIKDVVITHIAESENTTSSVVVHNAVLEQV